MKLNTKSLLVVGIVMVAMMALTVCAPTTTTNDKNNTSSTAPEIAVSRGLIQITNGLSYTNDFGTTPVGTASTAASFMIYSAGTADLIVASVRDNSVEFTTTTVDENLSTNGSKMFSVTYEAISAGTNFATISILNNDDNENPFTFTVTGIATN